jgi:hypothetical protein
MTIAAPMGPAVLPFTIPEVAPPSGMVEQVAAMLDGARTVRLAADPDDADWLLFVDSHRLGPDWRRRSLSSHALVQARADEVLVYDESDRPWPAYPGLYVSMPRTGFDPRRQVAVPYLSARSIALEGHTPAAHDRDLLFSFVGASTHPVREQVFGLQHPDGLVERTEGYVFWSQDHEDARRKAFRSAMGRSQFALCPRGHGTSSFRLYEAMAAGVAPVIVADEWVPPAGLPWDSFSIRWPEGRVDELPAELERRAGEAEAMGRTAQEVFEQHLDPGTILVGGLSRLLAGGPTPGPRAPSLLRWADDRTYRRRALAELRDRRRR